MHSRMEFNDFPSSRLVYTRHCANDYWSGVPQEATHFGE